MVAGCAAAGLPELSAQTPGRADGGRFPDACPRMTTQRPCFADAGRLVSPTSTIVQPSEVHTGLTHDPSATLAHLFETLVRDRR